MRCAACTTADGRIRFPRHCRSSSSCQPIPHFFDLVSPSRSDFANRNGLETKFSGLVAGVPLKPSHAVSVAFRYLEAHQQAPGSPRREARPPALDAAALSAQDTGLEKKSKKPQMKRSALSTLGSWTVAMEPTGLQQRRRSVTKCVHVCCFFFSPIKIEL